MVMAVSGELELFLGKRTQRWMKQEKTAESTIKNTCPKERKRGNPSTETRKLRVTMRL